MLKSKFFSSSKLEITINKINDIITTHILFNFMISNTAKRERERERERDSLDSLDHLKYMIKYYINTNIHNYR